MTEYEIVGGPSKFALMLGVFNREVVMFKSASSPPFFVRIVSIETLEDRGREAWQIKGFICEDKQGNRSNRRVCKIQYSERTRKGTLFDYGPEGEEHNLASFDRLLDRELEKKVVVDCKLAMLYKQRLADYSSGLDQHDRLVLQAYCAHRSFGAIVGVVSDHRLFVSMRRTHGENPGRR